MIVCKTRVTQFIVACEGEKINRHLFIVKYGGCSSDSCLKA